MESNTVKENIMVEATEIEKKSLEAHVELCAERYNAVDEKLTTLDTKISHLCSEIEVIKDTIVAMAEKRNDQLIHWGMGIIGFLTTVIGFFMVHYILK